MQGEADKIVIITGPTWGIGQAIALGLGGYGMRLVLACCDAERGQQTAQEIAARTGATDVEVRAVDFSSQQSIREFAREFRATHERLEVLINNAGMNRGTQPRRRAPKALS